MLADRSCRNPEGSFQKLAFLELRKNAFRAEVLPSSAWTVAVGEAVVSSTGDDGVDGGRRRGGGGGMVTRVPQKLYRLESCRLGT